jgi:hypothetical protein
MPFDYSGLANSAKNMIANFGAPATLRKTVNSGPAYNPTQSVLDYPCTVVMSAYSARETDGTLILARDRKAIVADLTDEPLAADTLVVTGIEYEIINVRTIKPGSTAVLWEIQARA